MKALAAVYAAAKVLAMLALTFALVAVGVAGLEVWRTAKQATALVAESHRRVVDTSQNLNAILLQVGLAADEARRASTEERTYLTTLNVQVTRDLTDVHKLLTASAASMKQIDPVLKETQKTIAGVQPVLSNLESASAGLSKVVNDPNIAKTMANVQQTSASVNHTTQMVDKKVEIWMRPASWAKRAGMTVVRITSWFVSPLKF